MVEIGGAANRGREGEARGPGPHHGRRPHKGGLRANGSVELAKEQSESLVNHAKRLAQEAGAENHYLQGPHRKDKLVDKLLRQRPISEGLICVLCSKE